MSQENNNFSWRQLVLAALVGGMLVLTPVLALFWGGFATLSDQVVQVFTLPQRYVAYPGELAPYPCVAPEGFEVVWKGQKFGHFPGDSVSGHGIFTLYGVDAYYAVAEASDIYPETVKRVAEIWYGDSDHTLRLLREDYPRDSARIMNPFLFNSNRISSQFDGSTGEVSMFGGYKILFYPCKPGDKQEWGILVRVTWPDN